MADRQITVKLCSKKIAFEPISEIDPLTEISVSIEETSKAVAVVPIKHVVAEGVNDCESEHSVIQVPLMAAGMSDTQIIECLWPDPAELSWKRGITFERPNGYITIEWSNPQDNCADCLWNATYIAGKNPYEIGPVYPYVVKSFRIPELGEIPQEGIDDDPDTSVDETSYWMAEMSSTDLTNETQPNFVPGEEIILIWEMKINDQIYGAVMGNLWFSSPLMTGGQIISKTDENLITQTWTVEVEGAEITVIPTDFAQYDIGSWVYLLKQTSLGNAYRRNNIYTHEDNENARCIPLDFSGSALRVMPEGAFETKLFDISSDFSDFEICYHEGVITEVNNSANTANVTVTVVTPDGSTEQDFTGVSIFYHCPDSYTVDDGHKAFVVGDNVLILNENTDNSSISSGDLSIIGFTDKLEKCTNAFFIRPKFNGTVATKGGEFIQFELPETGLLSGTVYGTEYAPPPEFGLEGVAGLFGPFEVTEDLPIVPVDAKFENKVDKSYFTANVRNEATGNAEVNIWEPAMYVSEYIAGINADYAPTPGWVEPDLMNVRFKYDQLQYRTCPLSFVEKTVEIIDGKSYDIYSVEFTDLKRIKYLPSDSSGYSIPFVKADDYGTEVRWAFQAPFENNFGYTATFMTEYNPFTYNEYYKDMGDYWLTTFNDNFRHYSYTNSWRRLFVEGVSTTEQYKDAYTVWTDANGDNPVHSSATWKANINYNIYGNRFIEGTGDEYIELGGLPLGLRWNWEHQTSVTCSMEDIPTDVY